MLHQSINGNTMKKIVYIIAVFFILSACTSKPGFQLSGSIDGFTSGDIILLEQRIDKEYVKIDSVISPDGTFEFTGSLEIPDVYYVSVPGKRGRVFDNQQISTGGYCNCRIGGKGKLDAFRELPRVALFKIV